MPLLHIVILALIQGITEFLPISSSGHLVLAHAVMDGNAKQGWANHMMMDVAVHIGTLFAVLLYFRGDVVMMVNGVISAVSGDFKTKNTHLITHIIIGSLPVIGLGLALHIWEPSWLLAVEIVAWTTLIFGVLLWIADHISPQTRNINNMGIKDALIIGCAQALALVPGTSRSGITMTAGRFLGFTRTESAHYSLLLGMVAISGAGVLGGLHAMDHMTLALSAEIILAAFIAFISGYAAIAVMMRWLVHASFAPFALYRVILGLALLGLLYWPGV